MNDKIGTRGWGVERGENFKPSRKILKAKRKSQRLAKKISRRNRKH